MWLQCVSEQLHRGVMEVVVGGDAAQGEGVEGPLILGGGGGGGSCDHHVTH